MSTNTNIHFPDPSAYCAGAIELRDDPTKGQYLDFTPLNFWPPEGSTRPDEPRFPAGLMALKIENRSKKTIDLKLEAFTADGSSVSCVSLSVSDEQWEGPEPVGTIYRGAWLWLDDSVRKIEVSASVSACEPDAASIGGVSKREMRVEANGGRITLSETNQLTAKSGEGTRVFSSQDPEDASKRRVRLKNRSTTSSMRAPGVTVDPQKSVWYAIPAGSSSLTVEVLDGRGVVESSETYEVYDGGGSTVTIRDVGTESEPHYISAPYAIVSDPSQSMQTVYVLNETGSSMRVWIAGDSTKTNIPAGGTGTFQFTDNDSQWALHWDDLHDDPKVIVKQDNCGEED